MLSIVSSGAYISVNNEPRDNPAGFVNVKNEMIHEFPGEYCILANMDGQLMDHLRLDKLLEGHIMDQASISNAWIKRLTIIALIMLLPACQSADTRRFGGILGSVAGSIGGSYLGSALGGSTAGRIVGAVAGGVAGYYVGSTVGGYLGKEDKQRMAQASQAAFDTGQPQTFSNPDSRA